MQFESIVLPEGLEIIVNNAFQFMHKLKNINIPSTVKIIGRKAFYQCKSLETEIVIPEGVEEVGEEVKADVPPILLDNRVLIPARAMFEALGAQIGWEENTRTVTAMTTEKNVAMQIDNPQMSVNGVITELDVAPRILINRTLVPARAISESLGAMVEWDEERQTVVVTY